jgi:proteasome lid subunit RPN8/RPN11
MSVTISSTLLARLFKEATTSPGEICGLLFGTGEEIRNAEHCRNVAEHAATAFEIDPAALIAAHRAARAGGPAIIGCYHSHPGGTATPSPRDAAAAAPDGAIWLIVAADGAQAWRAIDAGSLHGRFAPVALVVG